MNTDEFSKKILTFENSLHIFAMNLTRNYEDAKDLVQETFLKAILYQDRYTVDKNIKAWLFTILRNTYLNQITKLSSKNKINEEIKEEYILKNRLSEMESTDSKINANNINKVIENLAEEYKTPFKMFLDGFKYKEISNKIKIPIGTVKSRIFLARRILTENLQDFR
ncbi:MAG: sigma-70 family RNA polymerase sigma factor [Bacteroidales bacterium]|jgi:RNA polymerase sigma-70 factor (ECF subfamily)|nr:sigma-70 family RNA polymerase sigma factor [Bacteroidales bacterium]